ncbi:MAG: ABC transporter transmembrane domain-containing protein, partial [Pseudomonadota bacterium]
MAAPHALPDDHGAASLSAAAWIARHYNLPFSDTGARARLPEGFWTEDHGGLPRIFKELGLRSQVMRRAAHLVDPGALPAILFTKAGAPLILVGVDSRSGRAAIVDPTTGQSEELGTGDLKNRVGSQVVLVTPDVAPTQSRLSPAAQALTSQDGQHWLWSELARHKSAWFQVFLAAFGVNLAGLALPIFVMNVFDRVIPNLAFVTLITLALGVALALTLDLLLRLVRSTIIQRVSRRADLALASKLFQLAMAQRILKRKGGASGAITNLRDFEVVRDFFTSSTLISLIDLAFIGVFLTVLMMIVGPLAWVPILAIPIMLIIAILAQLPIARAARKAQQMTVKRNQVLIESLTGLETVKSVGAEPVLQREWENAVAASSRVTAQTRNWSNFTASAAVLVQQSVSAAVICLGVFLVAEGQVSLGALIAANILSGRILAPLAGVAQTIFRANFALSSMRSISDFVDTELEHKQGLRSDLSVTEGRIELRGLSFTYPEAKVPALREVSATFEPGSVTALLGRIGSGKST